MHFVIVMSNFFIRALSTDLPCARAASHTHLAKTLEVLGKADLLRPLRFAFGLCVHGETSKLNQQQVLRKVSVNLLLLQREGG